MKTFQSLGYQNVNLTGDLASGDPSNVDSRYELEPFKIASDSDNKTFYRIKVTYTVTAEHPTDKSLNEILSFKRKISTSATNPEDAIIIASQFKETVRGYALKEAGISNIFDADKNEDFDEKASSSRSFTFNFSRNAANSLTHLQSIKVKCGKKRG